MTFSITTTRTFAAAHQLRLYDGSMEPLHGHNWKVSVTVSVQQLDTIGVVMDFHELERLIDAVIGPMHNRHLNDLDVFRSMNPSAENVALHVGRTVANALPRGVSLVAVKVWETDNNCAAYHA
jgi:6-pyruvoyltetrahydropterin/6-carboxytetrahydropterin synthase